MRQIRFGDLRINNTAKYYLNRALEKNWVSEGDNVREFEQKFAERFGYKYAIATSSGTEAGNCCCAAINADPWLDAQRGDEIIVPALCFVSCANSVLAAGFTPKFADIDRRTLNVNPELIEKTVTPKTRAIMAVHTMGKPCEMDEIVRIAFRQSLIIIEDNCEAHGARYRGRVVGHFGNMAYFSFYTAHQVVCGEGGMVVTDNDRVYNFVKSVKSHGRSPGTLYFDFQRVGFNAKMNDLEAAIGLGELEDFDKTFLKRRQNRAKLLSLIENLEGYFYLPKEENYEVISPHAFPLVLKDEKYGDGKYGCTPLYKHLERNGIECKTLFGSLPTQHKAFEFLGYKYGDFPEAEYVGRNGLQFGIHQYLTDDDLVYIADTLRSYFRSA